MKYTVVTATALSLCVLSSCGGAKHDQAAQAPPPVQVEKEGGVSLITVDHPNRFPVVTATRIRVGFYPQCDGHGQSRCLAHDSCYLDCVGRVVAIHARMGDTVRKGELLMEVQSNDVASAFQTYLKAVNDERLTQVRGSSRKLLHDKGGTVRPASWRSRRTRRTIPVPR